MEPSTPRNRAKCRRAWAPAYHLPVSAFLGLMYVARGPREKTVSLMGLMVISARPKTGSAVRSAANERIFANFPVVFFIGTISFGLFGVGATVYEMRHSTGKAGYRTRVRPFRPEKKREPAGGGRFP